MDRRRRLKNVLSKTESGRNARAGLVKVTFKHGGETKYGIWYHCSLPRDPRIHVVLIDRNNRFPHITTLTDLKRSSDIESIEVYALKDPSTENRFRTVSVDELTTQFGRSDRETLVSILCESFNDEKARELRELITSSNVDPGIPTSFYIENELEKLKYMMDRKPFRQQIQEIINDRFIRTT
uniref:Uncharacterized protein n=1 Tax=viral metagenome TaxID=1070528 RepID=A0A6C0BKW0_9ZZZZ